MKFELLWKSKSISQSNSIVSFDVDNIDDFMKIMYDYLHDSFDLYKTMYDMSRKSMLYIFDPDDIDNEDTTLKKLCKKNMSYNSRTVTGRTTQTTFHGLSNKKQFFSIIIFNNKDIKALYKDTKNIVNIKDKVKLIDAILLHEVGHAINAFKLYKEKNKPDNIIDILKERSDDAYDLFNEYMYEKYITPETPDVDINDILMDTEDVEFYYNLPPEKAANDAVGLTYKDFYMINDENDYDEDDD